MIISEFLLIDLDIIDSGPVVRQSIMEAGTCDGGGYIPHGRQKGNRERERERERER
jgi:hypothetical protein